MMKKGYTSEPLSFSRKMVAASASVTAKKKTFHSLAEVDISEPRRLINAHFEKTGLKLSLTAYIVYCLAQVIRENPQLNSFVRRNRLITLDELTIGVLVECEFDGEKVPEHVSIKAAQDLTLRQINEQIREFKSHTASFDHDIVDGAPAARFMNQFLETVRSGRYLTINF